MLLHPNNIQYHIILWGSSVFDLLHLVAFVCFLFLLAKSSHRIDNIIVNSWWGYGYTQRVVKVLQLHGVLYSISPGWVKAMTSRLPITKSNARLLNSSIDIYCGTIVMHFSENDFLVQLNSGHIFQQLTQAWALRAASLQQRPRSNGTSPALVPHARHSTARPWQLHSAPTSCRNTIVFFPLPACHPRPVKVWLWKHLSM